MSRRATSIKTIREAGGDVLLFELGDAITGTGDMARIKVDAYAKAFPYMAYDVIGIGEMEAQYISQTGNSSLFGKSLATIGANVVRADNEKLLAPEPYVIKKTPSGLKIGVISVLGEQLVHSTLQEQSKIRITPAADALKKYVGKLREKSDLVVVLSHTGSEVSKKNAAEIPGIDVILSGHISHIPNEGPEQIGSAIFMQSKSSGKYVCKIVLDIDAERKIASFTGEYIPMTKDITEDAQMAALGVEHDKQIQEYYAAMRVQVAQYNPSQPYQPRGAQPFVSSAKCRECHSKEFESWQSTDHARAFESLKKENKQAVLECVSCHTTGFKDKGGFASEFATPQLAGVQCESCHGPGVMHVRRPGKGYGITMQSTCTECHNPARSPAFDYKTFRPRILHTSPDTVAHAKP